MSPSKLPLASPSKQIFPENDSLYEITESPLASQGSIEPLEQFITTRYIKFFDNLLVAKYFLVLYYLYLRRPQQIFFYFSFYCRPDTSLPKVNPSTLNPWIQPHSYAAATTRTSSQRGYSAGILVKPTLVTPLSTVHRNPTKKSAIFNRQTTDAPLKHTISVPVRDGVVDGENTIYDEEDYIPTLPPERFKIVEDNLFYETGVGKVT